MTSAPSDLSFGEYCGLVCENETKKELWSTHRIIRLPVTHWNVDGVDYDVYKTAFVTGWPLPKKGIYGNENFAEWIDAASRLEVRQTAAFKYPRQQERVMLVEITRIKPDMTVMSFNLFVPN